MTGQGLSIGYPERTKKSFYQPSIGNYNALDTVAYKTGDIVQRQQDGEYSADDQIKLRGYRIELSEIAHCIIVSANVVLSCNSSDVGLIDIGTGGTPLVKYLGEHLNDVNSAKLSMTETTKGVG